MMRCLIYLLLPAFQQENTFSGSNVIACTNTSEILSTKPILALFAQEQMNQSVPFKLTNQPDEDIQIPLPYSDR